MENRLFEAFPNKTKSEIIQLLSNSDGLTAKQVHIRLQRQCAFTSSYQALHKSLKQMLTENSLIKKNAIYCLNPEWVENLKKNAEQLSEKVKTGAKEINLEEMKEGETIHATFNGILEVGWFLIDKIMAAPNPQKKPCLALWRFCYSIIGIEAKQISQFKKIAVKNDWHAFIEEDTKVDRLFGDTLMAYGLKNIQYGVKCSTPLSDKIVIGDYVAELTYPTTFRKLWALQNKLPRKLMEFNLGNHLMFMQELLPVVEVIITKNRLLADEFRGEYLKPKSGR